MHLGRRTVDLIRQDNVREHRSLADLKASRLGLVDERPNEVCREQIRGKLNALIVCLQRLRQGRHGAGLSQARDPFQEHMSVGQEPHEQALEHRLLPNNDALHSLHDVLYKPPVLGD